MAKTDKARTEGMLRTLSPDQLRQIGVALFGDRFGWKGRVAEAIGVSPGAVTRWLSGVTPVPTPAALALQYMLNTRMPETFRDPLAPADGV